MAVKRDKLERIGMGLVLCIALLMFYAPLVVSIPERSCDSVERTLRALIDSSPEKAPCKTTRGA